jgi:intein/homing endonuclease
MSKILKDIIREEYLKCAANPVYFMKKYAKIQHPTRGTILFDLWNFQEDVLKDFQEHRYNICLKSRQLGISTLIAGYSLWMMLFGNDKNILVIATKQETAKNLVTKVRVMYDNLPSWLKTAVVEDNKLSLRLKNGSQIKAVSAAADAARSEALSLLIIDEAAFIDNIEEIWASAQSTINTGGSAIINSTPNGVGNFYHKQWVGAKTGENLFNPIFLHWTVHPERDQSWRDQQDIILGPSLAAQECFSGNVRVMTDMGWKPISDIEVGDFVLSHKGKFQRVVRKYVDSKNNLYRVKSSKNYKDDCYITSNHPIAIKNNLDISFIPVNEYNKNMHGVLSPNIDGFDKEITLDVYDLVSPKYFKKVLLDNSSQFYINDRKHKVIHNRYIAVGYDFGYFIGLYLAEGSGCRLRKTFSFNALTEQNTWPGDVQRILSNLFGIQNTQIRIVNQSCGYLNISSEIVASIIDKFVDGNRAWKKRLSPFAYKVGNKNFWKGVLDGIFTGDGCNTKTANHAISITSPELSYDILFASYMSGIFGVSSTINESSETVLKKSNFRLGNSTLHHKSTVRFLNTKNTDTSRITHNLNLKNDNGVQWNFEEIDNSIIKTVYNLEVENDNTYVTEFGLVHNCDGDFLSSGNSVVDGNIIDWYQKTYVTEPKERRGAEDSLWIWDYPDPNKTYMICADVARGDGKDYSAFHIIDIENVEQVAEYKGKLDTKSFGNLLVSIGTEYNDALLVVENANIGWAVLQQIIDRGYTNLYYTYKEDGYTDPSVHIPKGYDLKDKSQMVPGFSNTAKTRPLIVSKYEMYFRERVPIIKSTRLSEEMFVFIWKGGRAEAQVGYNDDLVMSFAIGLWVRDSALKLRQEGLTRTKMSLDYITKSSVILNSANMIDLKSKTGWSMGVGDNKKDEDLTWLVK